MEVYGGCQARPIPCNPAGLPSGQGIEAPQSGWCSILQLVLHYEVPYAAANLLKGAASLEASLGTLCSQVVRSYSLFLGPLPLATCSSHRPGNSSQVWKQAVMKSRTRALSGSLIGIWSLFGLYRSNLASQPNM